jgi:hypothetical protein
MPFMTSLCGDDDFPIEFLCGGAHISVTESDMRLSETE